MEKYYFSYKRLLQYLSNQMPGTWVLHGVFTSSTTSAKHYIQCSAQLLFSQALAPSLKPHWNMSPTTKVPTWTCKKKGYHAIIVVTETQYLPHHERTVALTLRARTWFYFSILGLNKWAQHIATFVTVIFDNWELWKNTSCCRDHPSCANKLVQMDLSATGNKKKAL
jgi:hypothetical protein